MLAKLHTFSLLGIEALPVEVEVDVADSALPKTVLVGLPEAAVKESTHRVERALVNSGFIRPNSRVVINLAPADLPKQAASFDLPITLGILAGSGQLNSERFQHYAVVGEALLWTFEAVLKDKFTSEVRDAWVAAYSWLAFTMQHAAASAQSDHGKSDCASVTSSARWR